MESRLPKYCTSCGKELIEERVINRYDMHDGHKIFRVHLKCPRYTENWSPNHSYLWIEDTKELV